MRHKYENFVSLTLLIAIVMGCVAWTVFAPRYADLKYREYIKLYQNGRLELALKEINKAVFFDPKNENYYWSRALAYWLLFKEHRTNTDFLEQSRIDWKKVINLKEGDESWSGWSEVYFGLAQAELNLKKLEECIVSYKDALRYTTDPVRSVGISSLIGHVYYIQGKYKNAVEWLDKVPEGDKGFLFACRENAASNHKLHNFKRAEELYLTVLAILPKDVQINSHLAHLYAEQGEYTKSVKYLKNGLAQSEDVGSVFDTISMDVYTATSTTVYLELLDYFFERFQDELKSYATGNLSEDSVEMKKINAFYRSVNKVVVHSLNNPNPEVVDYAKTLLTKIKEAGLYKEASLKNEDPQKEVTY